MWRIIISENKNNLFDKWINEAKFNSDVKFLNMFQLKNVNI